MKVLGIETSCDETGVAVYDTARPGADGLLVETHWRPQEALVDGHQSLTPSAFEQLMGELPAVCEAMGRTL